MEEWVILVDRLHPHLLVLVPVLPRPGMDTGPGPGPGVHRPRAGHIMRRQAWV